MKPVILFAIILFSIHSSSQTVTGFYSGTLYNDTTKLVQQYELALSEYRGKITGYSYVTFVSNDTFYYGIRKVTGHIEDNKLIVKDDKFIANNFPEAPAKGVKRLFVIPLDGTDTLRNISGNWQTNRTKKYYSIPGTVTANRSTDSAGSALFAHLKEMELLPQYADDLIRPEEIDRVAVARNERKLDEERKKAIAKAEKEELEKVRKNEQVKARLEKEAEDEKKKAIAKAGREERETEREREREKQKADEARAADLKNAQEEAAAKKAMAAVVVLPYQERSKRIMKPVEISSDSLLLTFYDNGVVDGDSISVYANGVNIVSNIKLAATATRKMIAVNQNEEMEILLVAENLGTIPPNTGLLMIRDGDQIYQLHFTADLQTNASIIVKRKKK